MSDEILNSNLNQVSSDINIADDCVSVASAISAASDSEKSVVSGEVIVKKSGIPKASGIKPSLKILKIDRPCHDHCTPKPALPSDAKREYYTILI